METKVLNMNGKEEGTANLADAVFSVKPNPGFLHEVVVSYLGNQRSGTADVKTRSEVSGTGKKPWKQKGTGRARHGSMRSPIWRHGGVAFGPTPRSFRTELPAAKRKAALAHALSAKYAEGNLVVIDNLALNEAKTKNLVAVLDALKADRKPLIVTASYGDANLFKAARNIEGLSLFAASDLHAYAVLDSHKVVITKDALEVLNKRFNKEAK